MSKGAPQRKHDLGRVFDALKYVVRSGIVWRYLPSDFPPWAAVCQRVRGSKIHAAVDSLGHLLAAVVTLANENERR
jgi:transposase